MILRTREGISFKKIQIHTRCIILGGSPAEIGPTARCEGGATKTPRHLDSILSNGYTSGMKSQDTPNNIIVTFKEWDHGTPTK